jgi:hypothetical protein
MSLISLAVWTWGASNTRSNEQMVRSRMARIDDAGRAHRMEATEGEKFEYLVGLSGAWGLLGSDGDVRANDGSLHHDEEDENDWIDEEGAA